MRTYKRWCAASDVRIGFIVALTICAFPAHPMAQSAGQLVQPSYAPDQKKVTTGLKLSEQQGLSVPEGADQLFVTPSGLEVEGGFASMRPITDTLEGQIAGRRVSADLLFRLAGDLERAYAEKGFLLARVLIPAQTLNDGQPLKLIVVDGFIERIDAEALSPGIRERVLKMAAPLVGMKGVTKSVLERRLLLAGDLPGLALQSTLKAGEKPGGAVLVLSGSHDPLSVTASAETGPSRDLGGYSLGLGVDLNNVLGLGETTYLRLSGYPGTGDAHLFSQAPRNRQLAFGFLFPLGYDGLLLNLEATDARSNPESHDLLSIDGHYQRLSTRLSYQWIRSRSLNATGHLSFDVIEDDQTLDFGGLQSPFAEDQLRVLRVGQSFDVLTTWNASLEGSVTASFGLAGFGASKPDDPLPMSRQDVSARFETLEASLKYRQALDARFDFSALLHAQTSFGQALPSSEQFGLGGPGGLSHLEPGGLDGDSGLMARFDLAMPNGLASKTSERPFDAIWSPYLFAAGGVASLSAPSALEDPVSRSAALGAGLKLSMLENRWVENTLVTLEYAHGWTSGKGEEDRLTLTSRVRF